MRNVNSLFSIDVDEAGRWVLTPKKETQAEYLIFDPGLEHTATCRSSISSIDTTTGQLFYRGRAIETLAGQQTFEAVGDLLLFGGACASQTHNFRPGAYMEPSEALLSVLGSMPQDIAPMKALMIVASVLDMEGYDRVAQLSSIVAHLGFAVCYLNVAPEKRSNIRISNTSGSFAEKIVSAASHDDPAVEAKAELLQKLLVLHADHEQNCSTTVARAVASSQGDLASAVCAGLAAFSGALHGGASDQVFAQHDEIIARGMPVKSFIEEAIKGRRRILGIGHRVYSTWDPRATFMRTMIDKDPRIRTSERARVALELADACSSHPFFLDRGLYPNPDLFNGIIFNYIGFAPRLNTALLSVSRTLGWGAQYFEHADNKVSITRPRQIGESVQ